MFRRTETINFRDFMNGTHKREKNVRVVVKGSIAGLVTGLSFKSAALADTGGYTTTPPVAVPANAVDVTDKIVHAFDPLVDLIVSLAMPVASVMIAGGALLVMIGQKEKGYQLLMNCSIGYVLVQMTPLFIDLLAGVGAAVS